MATRCGDSCTELAHPTSDARPEWPWDGLEYTIEFDERLELLEVLRDFEGAYDWPGCCAVGRASHGRVLDAGDRFLDHASPREARRLGPAIDELQRLGGALFYPWTTGYDLAPLLAANGRPVASVFRVQARPAELAHDVSRHIHRDATDALAGVLTPGRAASPVETAVAEIVLGDRDGDAALVAERLETLGAELEAISELAGGRRAAAVDALDSELLSDAAERDRDREARTVNGALVDQLDRHLNGSGA